MHTAQRKINLLQSCDQGTRCRDRDQDRGSRVRDRVQDRDSSFRDRGQDRGTAVYLETEAEAQGSCPILFP